MENLEEMTTSSTGRHGIDLAALIRPNAGSRVSMIREGVSETGMYVSAEVLPDRRGNE